MSNAFDMTSAIAIVFSGGLFHIEPVITTLFIVCSAAMVECYILNPCWCVRICKLFVKSGRILFYSVLTNGDNSAMALYDASFCGFLLGFKIEMILPIV